MAPHKALSHELPEVCFETEKEIFSIELRHTLRNAIKGKSLTREQVEAMERRRNDFQGTVTNASCHETCHQEAGRLVGFIDDLLKVTVVTDTGRMRERSPILVKGSEVLEGCGQSTRSFHSLKHSTESLPPKNLEISPRSQFVIPPYQEHVRRRRRKAPFEELNTRTNSKRLNCWKEGQVCVPSQIRRLQLSKAFQKKSDVAKRRKFILKGSAFQCCNGNGTLH